MTTTNPTRIIKDKFTIAETSSIGIKFPPLNQVKVVSESPHTVVLFGDLITPARHDNTYLWQAMDWTKFTWIQINSDCT